MKSIFSALFFAFIILMLVSFRPVLAQTVLNLPKIEYQKVNPGDDYKFIVKRLKEKVKLFLLFVFPSKKISFLSKLVDVRLSELKYVVNRKDIANIQTTSQRYAAFAGNATDFVPAKGNKEDKEKLVEKFNNHMLIIKELQKSYAFDTGEWMFLEHDINSLKSFISKLSE